MIVVIGVMTPITTISMLLILRRVSCEKERRCHFHVHFRPFVRFGHYHSHVYAKNLDSAHVVHPGKPRAHFHCHVSFPRSALLVTVVTSIGFALSMPLVVALRAASHLVFVVVGSLLLKRVPYLLSSLRTALPFNLLLGVLHGACESLVVTAFYFTGAGSESWYESGYVVTVLLLVGLGTVVHSMVDFTIAAAVWKPLSRMIPIPVSAKWRSASKAAAN